MHLDSMRVYFIVLLLVVTPGIVRSQAFSPPPSSIHSQTTRKSVTQALALPENAHTLEAGDLVRVTVFDVPEMSGESRVRADGTVRLPLLSVPVAAAGLTVDQLSDRIAAKLQAAGLVSHPQVTVEVKESHSNEVTISGAVKKPQIIPVFGHTTLLDALSQAEGLATDAGGVATITRGSMDPHAPNPGGGGVSSQDQLASQTTTVDLKRLMGSSDPRYNPVLYPGDRVTVERAGVVYVVGAVHRAGGYVLTSERGKMTVLKALALAEGVKSTALENKALIIRDSEAPSGMRREIPVKLKELLAGRAPDKPLQPNDILFVPDSNSEKALRRGAEAAIEITTGILIWRL